MTKYLIGRFLQTLLTLVIVSLVLYFLVNLMPGDPVYAAHGEELSTEEYWYYYYEMELDKPVIVRYWKWFKGAIVLDFGESYTYKGQMVSDLIWSRVPTSMFFSILSLLISFPIGVVFGVITAVKRGKPADTIITFIANICACLPQFWVGMIVMYVFALKLKWLPSYGFVWPWEEGWVSFFKHLAMPLFCLSLGGIAGITRQTRSSMLECIRQDYVMTARSKGLKEFKVITVHVMKNALIPIVTLLGNRLAHLMGGSMFVERVFTINAMGTLMLSAITMRDIPVIEGVVIITAFVACMVYILTDVLFVFIDPRIALVKEN